MSVVFAPINIALVKYWGKRDLRLNLPITSSLSITLGSKGAVVELEQAANVDTVTINSKSYAAIIDYLERFKENRDDNFRVQITTNIPVAAGFASSAAIYAGLIKALNRFYGWNLSSEQLSILARQGSGSACRSLWTGFVKWQRGEKADGSDSHGVPIAASWPELRIGLLTIAASPKKTSSREGMQHTVATSPLYKSWPEQVTEDLSAVERAISAQDFTLLGSTSERNALRMHATMVAARPALNYSLPATLTAQQKIRQLREQGTEVYFTQDAGPNLKLLFLAADTAAMLATFPELEVLAPFADPNQEQVILVTPKDRAIGVMEKIAAHRQGRLHRAFSVLIYRGNEVLLQQRQHDKYHCGGLWANSCCSHPRPGEDIISAAERRLREELGFVTELRPISSFQYRAEFTNGLTENELDHVVIGTTDQSDFPINRAEVAAYKWINLEELQYELQVNSSNYVPWLPMVLTEFKLQSGR